MRVLLVIPKITSFTAFLSEMSEALLDTGAEVHCACSPETLWSEHQPVKSRVRFHPIQMPRGMNPLGHWRGARALNELVRQLAPDVVHAHFSSAIFTTALARGRHWPTTLGTFHGVAFPLVAGLKGRILKTAESRAASRYDTVWVLTGDDRQALAAAGRRGRVEVTRSCGVGCDLDKFAPLPSVQRTAARARLGLSAEHIVFVFVGRFVQFKGFGLAVRTFLRLAPDDPRLRLLLVGAADSLHPSGLSADEEHARQDCPQIIDVGHQTDVRPYLAAADAMVFPSQREGFSVCLMEALAMGVPAITRNARGCREAVRDEIDGMVLDDPTPATLGEAMRRMANDAGLRTRFAAAAVAGRARFDRRHFIDEQLAIYREHTGANRSKAS